MSSYGCYFTRRPSIFIIYREAIRDYSSRARGVSRVTVLLFAGLVDFQLLSSVRQSVESVVRSLIFLKLLWKSRFLCGSDALVAEDYTSFFTSLGKSTFRLANFLIEWSTVEKWPLSSISSLLAQQSPYSLRYSRFNNRLINRQGDIIEYIFSQICRESWQGRLGDIISPWLGMHQRGQIINYLTREKMSYANRLVHRKCSTFSFTVFLLFEPVKIWISFSHRYFIKRGW